MLLIDESLCVGCDNCEKACAETHDGMSRLDREAGATYAQRPRADLVPPLRAAALHEGLPAERDPPLGDGEVYINDTCIGCGNCQANCPYGVIRMVYDAPKKPRPVVVAAVRRGSGPGEQPDYEPSAAAKEKGKKAVKCDAASASTAARRACARARPAPRSASGRSSSSTWSRSGSGDPPQSAAVSRRALPVVVARPAGRSRACCTRRRARSQPPNGGTWQGYVLGTIGALLIVWLTLLGVRKRRYSSTLGTRAGLDLGARLSRHGAARHRDAAHRLPGRLEPAHARLRADVRRDRERLLRPVQLSQSSAR